MQASSSVFCKKCNDFITNLQNEITKGHASELFTIPSFLHDVYDIGSLIGSGGFGIVFKAHHKLEDESYAIKVMNLQAPGIDETQIKENTMDLLNEIKINVKIHHENIIRYITSFQFSSENIVAIVMELAETSIDSLMNELSNSESFEFIKQICTGLDYLHNEKKVIHRDLKPQNILVLKGKIKICDFGIAKVKLNDNTMLSRMVGTPAYMAPELMNEEDNIDCKVDIWSLGIIIHQMMTNGLHPFGVKGKTQKNMMNGAYIINNNIKDQRIIKILKGCFEVDPQQRLDIKQILLLMKDNENFVQEKKLKGLIHWRLKDMQEMTFEILERCDLFFPEEIDLSLLEYLEQMRAEAEEEGWGDYFSNILKQNQSINADNFYCFVMNLYIYLKENDIDLECKYFRTAFFASLENYGRTTISELKKEGLINNASEELTLYMNDDDTNIIPFRQVERFALCQNDPKSILKKMEENEDQNEWTLYEIQLMLNSDPMNNACVYVPKRELLNQFLFENGVFILKMESFLLTQRTNTIEKNVSFQKIQACVTNDLDNHLELLEKSIDKCICQIKEKRDYDLSLSNKQLSNTKTIQLLAKEIEKQEVFNSLYFCNNLLENANMKNLEIFTQALEKNTSIENLYFGSNDLGKANAENVYLLAKVIEKNETIISLDLSYNNLGQASFENMASLMKALEKNTKICILDLSGNDLGMANIENLDQLAKLFAKNKTISYLKVSNNNLGQTNNKRMELVAKIIKNNLSLENLDLSGNDLGNTNSENMKVLTNAIEKNYKIFSLDLSNNNLGSGNILNMELLAKLIKGNENIGCLFLNNNGLGYTNCQCMELLADAIEKNKTIYR